jgi:hypothetical protein
MQQSWPAILTNPDEYLADPGPRSEVFSMVRNPLPTSWEAGMALEAVQAQAGHASIESTRVYLHLANDWLAGEYRRAAELIDADAAAVAEMLAVQTAAVR